MKRRFFFATLLAPLAALIPRLKRVAITFMADETTEYEAAAALFFFRFFTTNRHLSILGEEGITASDFGYHGGGRP